MSEWNIYNEANNMVGIVELIESEVSLERIGQQYNLWIKRPRQVIITTLARIELEQIKNTRAPQFWLIDRETDEKIGLITIAL